tara:strand:+ start:2905 stop:3333 length:429 start_codon:yes stop_codon:yes gene_type:complete
MPFSINLFYSNLVRLSLNFFIIDLCILFQPVLASNSNYFNNQGILVDKQSVYDTFYLVSEVSDFVQNNPILKIYGPLVLDINNVKHDNDIFFIPSLNVENKPFFLAINCQKSIFSIKDNIKWTSFQPFFTYELNILNDFCGL